MKKHFIKEEDGAVEAQLRAAKKDSKPVYNAERKLYFVSGGKYRRAVEIVDLITGNKVSNKAEDVQRTQHYQKQLAKHDISLKGEDGKLNPDVIPAVYEILGGLVRTEKEQDRAEEVKKVAIEKGKKRMIE